MVGNPPRRMRVAEEEYLGAMLTLFCSDPLHPRRPDPAYAAEVAAAAELDLPWALIDFEALTSGAISRAVRLAPEQSVATLGLYRGWMLRPTHYSLLCRALSERNIHLINDPASYIYCHYLPECYSAIAAYTPRTVWFHGTTIDMNRVLELVRPFGDAPLMVKDFVKSRKHEWQEACYIPSATDRAAVTRVVSRFLELQGEDLAEGLVFRQFIDFEPIGSHAVSGMPLIKEYRVFFLDSVPIVIAPYWEDGDYGLDAPPIEPFLAIARAIPSRLFTMDLAKRRDGAWMIVELGDGQVAGLPDSLDVRMFYQAIRQGLNLQPRQASGD